MEQNFWKKKALTDFSDEEWEAVCMRCGKCCMDKWSDDGYMLFMDGICSHFDMACCRCSIYQERLSTGNCLKVDLRLLREERELLPETCAYRLLFEGKDLPDYHPLISGDKNSVHAARKTVQEMPIKDKEQHLREIRSLYRMRGLPELPECIAMHIERTCLEHYPIPEK